jgi:hypothetical protein
MHTNSSRDMTKFPTLLHLNLRRRFISKTVIKR